MVVMASCVSNVRKSCYAFEYRITLLGAEGVGKSAIINQFINKQFLSEHVPTSEDHLTYVVEHKGNMCVCLFVDTAGSDDFPAMRKLSLAKGNVFVVVYAIDNAKSFTRAKHYVDEIKSVKKDSKDIKIMFVANKLDLNATGNRKVTYADGYTYCLNEINDDQVKAHFLEVTAKEGDSVQGVLYNLLAMFKIPSLVEVPVLHEQKMAKAKLRKHRKSKKCSSVVELKLEQKSFNSDSDSEFFGESLLNLENQKFRRRAGSQPNFTFNQVNLNTSTSTLSVESPWNVGTTKRRGSFSPNSSGSKYEGISAGMLKSHSLRLNKHTLKNQKSVGDSKNVSDSKSSSDDSGVSGDDSNSQGEISPRLSSRAGIRRESCDSLYRLGPRRQSLSEKMKGMFRKSKPVSESH